MKISKTLIFITTSLSLIGCAETTEEYHYQSGVDVPVEHDYAEVSDYQLLWESIFDVNKEQYYVYIYSTSCSHCSELKNYVIENAIKNKNVYFVKGTGTDQIGKDPKSTKYPENPGDIWILGYPSLLQISNKKCVKNLAGINQIKGELK